MANIISNIGTTAVLIHSMTPATNETFRVRNIGNTLVYLGEATVGTNTGVPFGPGSDLAISNTFPVGSVGAAIYAVTGTTSNIGTGQLQWNALST